MMSGIIPTAGQVRVGAQMARAGNTHFLPASDVPAALTVFFDSLEVLCRRSDVTATGKAAWALTMFLCIHPFSDGNGRTARIVANYVLSRCGLPFTISFPTAARRQLTKAVRFFHRTLVESLDNLSLLGQDVAPVMASPSSAPSSGPSSPNLCQVNAEISK